MQADNAAYSRGAACEIIRVAERQLEEAVTCLSGMVVDCTRSMRPDELSEVESRRVTALGYLDQLRGALDKAWWKEANFVVRKEPSRG